MQSAPCVRLTFNKLLHACVDSLRVWCAVYAYYYYEQGAISLHTALLNIAKIPVN
jgi:hypothetical protein